MSNAINTTHVGLIQSYASFKAPENLFNEKGLRSTGQETQYDKLELTNETMLKGLSVPKNVEIEKVSREKTIAIETLESRIKHIDASLEKADSLNLSYSQRLEFLKNEGKNWVEDVKKNDPEMFVQWLKSNKENIMLGRNDLASLPSGFTMKDYYSYVNEPFSILV